MSEYQYYEFRAIDRPLTEAEMRKVGAFSTRADISPHRFVNTYEWGDFKGNVRQWMEKWYDAYLYLANWGTRELMLRLPARLLDADLAEAYCPGESVSVMRGPEHHLLWFSSEDEGADFLDDGSGSLSPILPMREEIASGDLRPLYLGWLLAVQNWDAEEGALEPPVPPGLGKLSRAQEAFAEFLRIDEDLIRAAAKRSAAVAEAPSPDAVRAWVAALPNSERTELLVRAAQGEGSLVGAELNRRARLELRAPSADASSQPRTVAELRAAATEMAERRERAAAERAAREKAKLDEKLAAVRADHLAFLAAHEADQWQKVETLVATKQPRMYDEAVRLVRDLCEVAARAGRTGEPEARVLGLRERHARKPAFIKRLLEAVPPPSGW